MAVIITATIPNGLAIELGAAFDNMYPDRPFGTTQLAWSKQQVRKYLKDILIAYRVRQTDSYVDSARDQADTDSDAIIVT
jgi:hypothetical protein